MLSKKLGLTPPQDISARMELTNSAGEVVRDSEGKPGWIEFWGPEAEPVRAFRQEIRVDSYVEDAKERSKGAKVPTREVAARKIEKIDNQLIEGISWRTKDWYLVASTGEPITDYPCNFENAKALFGDPEHRFLVNICVAFLADAENFFPAKHDS